MGLNNIIHADAPFIIDFDLFSAEGTKTLSVSERFVKCDLSRNGGEFVQARNTVHLNEEVRALLLGRFSIILAPSETQAGIVIFRARCEGLLDFVRILNCL
jgi:hypothetical protein